MSSAVLWYEFARLTGHPMHDSTLATNMEPCLDCACSNPANASAKRLLESCGARTSTGVSAALFIADVTEQLRIAGLVVAALEEQRRGCDPSRCERLVISRG